jgi:hypothetical protein
MSAVMMIRRKSNLSKMIDTKGGVTVLAALRGAEKEIAPLREEGLAILDEALAALDASAATPPGQAGWLEGIYRAAADIIDVCPPELTGLYAAAYSLCELADLQRRAGRCETPPVQVHINALRLLRQPGQPEAVTSQVLAGLESLLARETARGG